MPDTVTVPGFDRLRGDIGDDVVDRALTAAASHAAADNVSAAMVRSAHEIVTGHKAFAANPYRGLDALLHEHLVAALR